MLSPKMMGIVSMVGGIVLVSLQDAMVKLFADSYALHEVMLVRSIVAPVSYTHLTLPTKA